MVLKFQGKGTTWVFKESNRISHSHFIIEPKEMEKVNIKIDLLPATNIPDDALLEAVGNPPNFYSFQDLITDKIANEFNIVSDNIYCCYDNDSDMGNEKLFFGIAVVLDNNEVYILDGAKQAYIINDNGKTIDKL